MAWEVEFTDEFGEWWDSLSEEEQESIDFGVRLLQEYDQASGGLMLTTSNNPTFRT